MLGFVQRVRLKTQYGDDMYEARTYRENFNSRDLCQTTCIVDETDLMILSSNPFDKKYLVSDLRDEIKSYIKKSPSFETSLVPLEYDPQASQVINHMIKASQIANVGPMATVAGMVSHYVGESMVDHDEVMIENGGDIYLRAKKDKVIAIYAGESPFSNQVALKISHRDTPLGICTSAGTVGHSLSFGKADAVVVLSKDTLLADATATSIANLISTKDDIRKGLEFGKKIPGIIGVVIILGEELGAFDYIESVQVNES